MCWVIVNDFADDTVAMRGSQSDVLESLFVRGRHYGISTIVATQKFRLLSPVLRTIATALFCFRFRSKQDQDACIDEVSAVIDKKTLMRSYTETTNPQYGFLFIDLQAPPDRVCWSRFDYVLK